MSAIEFIISGGMANVGGNLQESDQKHCNNIIKEFGERLRLKAIQLQIPASNIAIFQSTFLFVGKDLENFFFIFSDKPGGNTIIYNELSDLGKLSLQSLNQRIRIEVGEVTWAFLVSKILVFASGEPLNNEINKIVNQYLETILQTIRKKDVSQIDHEFVNLPELSQYVTMFRNDYPNSVKTAFIMMQFSNTPAHLNIVNEIKRVLKKNNIIGLRADDKEYADDLFLNVRTYMQCCTFGISIFERLIEDDFNPNVSLELGYMFGLNKPVCLLKDQTLKHLHTDLVGKLYKIFDPQDIIGSIESPLEKWLKDKGMI